MTKATNLFLFDVKIGGKKSLYFIFKNLDSFCSFLQVTAAIHYDTSHLRLVHLALKIVVYKYYFKDHDTKL